MNFLRSFIFSIILINTGFLLSQEVIEPDDSALLEEAISIEASSANAAADRQSYIDNIDSQIITLIGDIQFLSQQLDLTNIYNRQMQDLINSQNQEIQSINEQMVELDNTNRGILPKLEEMILTLESIVQNDIPFLLDERNDRITNLKDILLQSNVSTSEKFRRVFEAYQIENEYGRTIESYNGYIEIDNDSKAVEYFRLGRLGLFYRTLDGKETGFWDNTQKKWEHKGSSLDNDIKLALDIANRQSPPNFISLPLKPVNNDE